MPSKAGFSAVIADLEITPEAELDMTEAFDWYESCQRGLGEEFAAQLDTCFHAICRMPEMHAMEFQEARRALLRRFPYSVFYRYVSGRVTVLAVFHNARDSRKWRARLQ